jgi:cyclopropane fatty-acyl-phospholipid synthase-like methyltransferase
MPQYRPTKFCFDGITHAPHYFLMRAKIYLTRLKDLFFEKVFLRRELRDFWLTLGGHILFQGLSSGVRFDLFTLLEKNPGLHLEDIATKLNIDKYPCRILLLSLTASRILKKKGSKYYNTRVSRVFLVKGSRFEMTNIILWQHFINYRAMFYFYESIRANTNLGLQVFKGEEKTLYERLHHAPELHKIFQDAMQEISSQANSELAQSIDLGDCKTLVDVGGGNGSNLIRLVKKFPNLKGILFDFPQACAIADENFKKNGLQNLIRSAPGNCFKDKFPSGIDAILFCHFFTIWSPEENKVLIKKSYEALPEKGKLFVFNMAQSDSEDGPLTAAFGSPYFLTLATGKGMLYTAKEYKQWMLEAGFSKVDVVRLPRDHVIMTAHK